MNQSASIAICANCSTELKGNYCHQCGQKKDLGRITAYSLLTDVFFSAVHVEKKGLPYTVRALTLQPGKAILNVIQGQKLSLYPPFKYLILVGAIVIIFSLRYKFFHNELTQSTATSENGLYQLAIVQQHREFFNAFFYFAEENATFLNIIAIPIFSFFSWVIFYKRGFNYGENIILNTYITAHQLLFILVMVPFLEFFTSSRHILLSAYTVITFAYNGWVYMQFFKGSKIITLILSSLAIALAYFYQFPANLITYYFYHHYLASHFHWVLGF